MTTIIFIVDISVNYKDKVGNPLVWYQSIYNFPIYNNYYKSFIDFIKISKVKLYPLQHMIIFILFFLLILIIYTYKMKKKITFMGVKKYGL